ncbi:MAG: hypothetical protein K9K38_22860 [Rhodoferax sp.]|nr:hypothetical protein [Rhodoferax sp.]
MKHCFTPWAFWLPWRLFIALCLAYLPALLWAADAPESPAVLHDMAVLVDTAGVLDIDTVVNADPARFKAVPAGSFAGGFTRSAHWFRFTVAHSGETWLELQPPVLDDLRLFERDPRHRNVWLERRAGDTLPFAVREVPYRGFVFRLQHTDATPHTYYLRLQTTSSSVLSVRLWTPMAFMATTTLEGGLLMASLVVILVMLLLNLNNWVWLRDSITPWFIAYLLLLLAFYTGTTGFLQQYLFANWPLASNLVVIGLSLPLIGVGTGFYRRFFGIGRDTPVLFWLYEINTWLPIAALPVALSGNFTDIAGFFNSAAAVMTTVGLWVSYRLWRRGAAGAAMMFAANLINMVSILLFVLLVLGRLNGGFMLWNSLHIGTMGSILAVQLALGARARSLSDARIMAEQVARDERAERIRQGQFLAMLAHELRTALSVLQMAVGLQPMTPKSIASAQRAMAGMREVIDRSIWAEKLADGRLQPVCQPCDLATLMQEVIADSRDPARVQWAGTACTPLQTDPLLLHIVLSNLIDNALKYGAVGQAVQVTLQLEDPSRLQICNAVGPAGRPDPDKVFEKYYRAAAAHHSTGSGLGLYIAKAMTRLLGGELRYLPAADKICFELQLQGVASFSSAPGLQ